MDPKDRRIAELEDEVARLRKAVDAAGFEGYRFGLQRAGNMNPRIPYGADGGRMVNHLRARIDAEVAALVHDGKVAE